jgi:hypothetical protein
MFECVVKTVKNKRGDILWRAIYVDNKKEIENNDINLDEILPFYAPTGKWKEEVIMEDDDILLENIKDYFPENDDFSFLLDFTDLEIGKEIYMRNGINIVTSFWKDYRGDGMYDVWMWEEIGDKWYAIINQVEYVGHNVTKFKVENDENEYVWEDWNYQQSFLSINYNQ